MEPDNNNPIAPNPNGGVDFTNLNGSSDNGLSMADSMSAAAENLTSAGMAADMIGTTPIDDNQGVAASTEPLTPAAPVPGSIGSVTSVPPVQDQNTMNAGFAQDSTMAGFGAAPQAPVLDTFATAPMVDPTPVAEPNTFAAQEPVQNLQAQFDPFNLQLAQPAAPAFQPQAAPAAPMAPSIRSKGGFSFATFFDVKTIVLCVVAVLFLTTTITFGVMFVNAKNTPKVVYVDNTPPPVVSMFTCTTSGNYAYLANYEEDREALGSRAVTMSFSDDNLTGFGESYVATYENNVDATLAGGVLSADRTTYYRDFRSISFSIDAKSDDNVMTATVESDADAEFTRADALTLVYGEDQLARSLYAEDVQAYYEAAGYVCAAE